MKRSPMRAVLTAFSFLFLLAIIAGPALAQGGGGDGLLQPATPSVLGTPLTETAPAPETPQASPPTSPDGATQAPTADLKLETGKVPGESTAIPPDEIPEIILKEMQQVEKNCSANVMYAAFHDCRCIAVKFLDARIKSNPETSGSDRVFQSIQTECPDEPGIAGFVYKSCADVMRYARPKDFEKFCKCSANQVARNYSQRPRMNMRYIDNLRKSAFVSCGIAENPAYNSPYLQK
ncbi:MAG: hypothetical protein HYU57_00545 [Micavibrio aeruginosavorus]|nr:hypothetical protein [Micavibrio aeruginosavorus]